MLGVKEPKPALGFPALEDITAFVTKVGWEWFEAMDPGPCKQVDGRLWWIAGL